MRSRTLAWLGVSACLCAWPANATIPQQERDALTALYEGTNGDSWYANDNWRAASGTGFNSRGTECTWHGITCDAASSHVTGIDLSSNGLSGSLSGDLTALLYLEVFEIGANWSLSPGPIPDLSAAAGLRQLGLASTYRTGPVPSWLGTMTDLEHLNLQSCYGLDPGPIPDLGAATRLSFLGLYYSNRTGAIPSWLSSATALEHLDLAYNWGLDPGPIPDLRAASGLRVLDLFYTGRTGDIPDWLGGMTALEHLSLGANWGLAAGPMPAWLPGLTALEVLDLSDCNRTGAIPDLSSLAGLEYLYLEYNWSLDEGPIPAWLSGLSSLRYLDLGYTNRTGEIPMWLGSMPSLQYLYLYSNQLTGSIPSQLGSLPGLWTLNLSWNQLAGTIPDLGNVNGYLYLDGNPFDPGPIPGWIQSSEQLYALDLGATNRTGSIPSWLASIPRLRYLYLNDNQLTGSVPAELSETGLWTLDLSSNQLSGSIPDLSGVQGYLYLDENPFEPGPVPSWIEDMTDLYGLGLASTGRTGSIPAWLDNLYRLNYLYLEGNSFTGTIPAEIGSLTNLRYLKLASNQLLGPVPASLASLTTLYSGWGLDLRWNALYTASSDLSVFLDSKQREGDWAATQTVPPTSVSAGDTTSSSVALSWSPVAYTDDPGWYRVLHATTSGGPYQLAATTGDKMTSSATVTGLDAGTAYYLTVQTVTDSHALNANRVTSDFSSEISATTPGEATCSVDCSATVPLEATVAEAIAFQAEATASNCQEAVSYRWTFGDGAAASQQNPRRAYSAAGTYTWAMTASAGDTTCERSGDIYIQAPGAVCGNFACEPGETTWACWSDCGLDSGETGRAGGSSTSSAVPAAVGGSGGVGGTFWLSEAMLYNSGTTDATVNMVFTPDDQPDQPVSAGPMTLSPESARFFENFVLDLFASTSNGCVHISADQPLMFVSRTFNDQPQGTYGQFLGAVSTTRALGVGDLAYLIGLSENAKFRSNLILQEVAGLGTKLEVSVYTGGGVLVGKKSITIPASAKVQHRLLALGFSGITNGFASVRVTQGGQIVAIASVADQSTGDAMTLDCLHPAQVQLADAVSAAERSTVEPPHPASKASSTVDFTWSPAYPAAGETIQFTDLSSPAPSSWMWNFGDGTTSREQHPTHSYDAVGSYQVSLSVPSDLGTVFETRTLTVVSMDPASAHFLLPVIAHLAGAEGTVWRSDVWIMNSFNISQQVWLEYHPVGAEPFRERIVVTAGTQQTIEDAVADRFPSAGDGKGSLHIFAPEGVFVHSRTYNLGAGGTFGQAIPALGGGDLLARDETGVLLKLKSTSNTRCNIGFTEFDGEDTRVEVQLYAATQSGLTSLATRRYDVPAHENVQVNLIFYTLGLSDEYEEALAYVKVIRGGRVYAYASNTDNRTGDSEFIPAMRR